MSQELKVKFSADASDFNGAVKQIEGKLKGVGKIGQGAGLGNVTGGLGNMLGGVGSLGLVGGGFAGAAGALLASLKWLRSSLDERTKAMETGMPVAQLTTFGRYIEAFFSGFDEAKRVFTGLPKLATEGLNSYQSFVTGESQDAARIFADSQERAAFALAELEKTVRYEIKTSDAMAKARERIAAENRTGAARTVADVASGTKAVDNIIGGYSRANQITEAEKSGDKFGAELMRITDQINAELGKQLYSTTDVAQIMGPDIQKRLDLNAPDGTLQTSPELSDRLRRIGGGGGGEYDQTSQVFKDSLSIERQQLAALTVIKDKVGGAALSTR